MHAVAPLHAVEFLFFRRRGEFRDAFHFSPSDAPGCSPGRGHTTVAFSIVEFYHRLTTLSSVVCARVIPTERSCRRILERKITPKHTRGGGRRNSGEEKRHENTGNL